MMRRSSSPVDCSDLLHASIVPSAKVEETLHLVRYANPASAISQAGTQMRVVVVTLSECLAVPRLRRSSAEGGYRRTSRQSDGAGFCSAIGRRLLLLRLARPLGSCVSLTDNASDVRTNLRYRTAYAAGCRE